MTFSKAAFGVIFACLSALMFSTGDLLVFEASVAVNPLMIYVANANFALLLCSVCFCVWRPEIEFCNIFQHVWGILSCGSLQTLGQMSLMFSIMIIGPGTAVSLYYTMPIFTIFLSYVFARTEVRCFHIFASLCSIAGVIFTTRSCAENVHAFKIEDDLRSWIGVPVALAAALSHAGSIVVRRVLQKYEIDSLVCTVTYLSQYSLVSLALCTIYGGWTLPDNRYDVVLLMALGLTGFSGTFFLYLGVASLEHPSTVSVILTSCVPLVYFGQIVFFTIPFQWSSFIGAVLICCSCVGVALHSLLKPDEAHSEDSEDEQQLVDSVN